MKNKRAKIGDIKLSNMKDRKGRPIICVKTTSFDDGANIYEWEDYETHILHTRMGMDLELHEVHTLQHFVDTLNEDKSQRKEKCIFDSDIRAINIGFIINALKQLMGAKSAYTGKETTKIYINCVRKAIELLEEAVKRLDGIKEDDFYENV